jgi:predicted outer membrane repeat protein
MCYFASSIALRNCTVTGNSSWRGGGLDCSQRSSALVIDCAFTGNSSLRGGAVSCTAGGTVTVEHSTLVGNAARLGGGVYSEEEGAVTIKSSVLWDNAGQALAVRNAPAVTVRFSCIQGELPSTGPGNINLDPLFGAWGDSDRDVFVDSNSLAPGNGTPGKPFPDLCTALGGYSLALAPDSPCRGTGEGGSDMGASAGVGSAAGQIARVVHLAPGNYNTQGFNLALNVSLRGSDRDGCILKGSVFGLRTGSSLENLTVTRGAPWDA